MNEIDSYYEAQQWAAIAPFIWVASIIFGILTLWALIVVIVACHRYLARTRSAGPRNQLEQYEQRMQGERQASRAAE